jgi:metal-responsive CopG/Arc/MetJ family transcriptional regulator
MVVVLEEVVMHSKTVGFAIDETIRPDLDAVVQRYAGGNRSEFLRVAVRRYKADMLRERLFSIREEARTERGGKVFSHDEVLALIAEP